MHDGLTRPRWTWTCCSIGCELLITKLFVLISENMRANKPIRHDRTSVMSLAASNRQLCLNCWVIGDKANRVFTVEIADTKNVSALKYAIKEKKPVAFQHVDADAIDLWKVRERIGQRSLPLIYPAGLHSSEGPLCCLAKAPRSRTCERCQQTGPHRSIAGAVWGQARRQARPRHSAGSRYR